MTSILCFNEECSHNDNMYTDGSGYCMKDKITIFGHECIDAEYNFDEEN